MPSVQHPSEEAALRFRQAARDHQAGDLEAATRGYRAVLDVDPAHLGAINNLAAALVQAGEAEAAEQCYRDGLSKHPDSAELHANLGNLERDRGDDAGAAESYGRAVDLNPALAEVRYALAVVLRRLGRAAEATTHLRRATQDLPGDPRPATALAQLALDAGDADGALAETAAGLDGGRADADLWNLRGIACKELARYGDAAEAYGRALSLSPDHAEARYNRGIIGLLRGDMPAAWTDYEFRWRSDGEHPPGWGELVSSGKPFWNGADPNGLTILLTEEQGYGDTLQSIRYAPLLKDRGARVLLRCRPALRRLFQSAAGIDGLIGFDEPLPPFDAYLPVLSLPHRFQTDAASIPSPTGYLEAPTATPLVAAEGEASVGLVWAGSPTHDNDRSRSLAPALYAPLLETPGFRFYSLQMGAADPAARDLTAGIGDFADTAAVLTGLDLLITVDTAVAHLAGALGRPAWVLLPHVPDWRWMLEREDTPWYTSLRLFRQSRRGDWKGVIHCVAAALRSARLKTP